MSLYFETIQVRNGELKNLSFHQQRFQQTRRSELRLKRHPSLEDIITLPEGLEHGLFKCKLIYGKEIECIEYEPYIKKEVRSLKLVRADKISYGFKYLERGSLEDMFQQRGSCDDILIVHQGCISDTSIANVVFFDGSRWFTPDSPLLPGTMRASLIEEGKIISVPVSLEDLKKYQRAKLINAMNNLQIGPELSMDSISW